MSRPPLEVADLIRSAGAAFLERNPSAQLEAHQSTASHCAVSYRCTRRSSRSVHPSGIVATISYTAAATDHARSVRPRPGNAGSPHVKRTSPATRYVHVSSNSSAAWLHWLSRTRKSSTSAVTAPVQKHFSEVARDPKQPCAEIASHRAAYLNQKLGLISHIHCVIPRCLSLDHTHGVKSRDRSFFPFTCSSRFRGKLLLPQTSLR